MTPQTDDPTRLELAKILARGVIRLHRKSTVVASTMPHEKTRNFGLATMTEESGYQAQSSKATHEHRNDTNPAPEPFDKKP
jgi:hypothetical protein